MDRKGRRVFCAKFDQNPKWGQRHNVTSPHRSIYVDELLTWPDDEVAQYVPQSYLPNDRRYSVDEDDATKDIQDNY